MRPLPLPVVVPVAGVSFRQDAVLRCREGDGVDLVAVDDNPADPNAVEVRRGGALLGFVPAALAPRLRAGGSVRWRGVVTAMLHGESCVGLRVRVESGSVARHAA